MGRTSRELYRTRLKKILSRANDEDLIRLVRAISAAQSHNPELARQVINLPKRMITSDITSPNYVHPWSLETLVNECLRESKARQRKGKPYRILNCTSPAAVVSLVNVLRKLENSEDSVRLKKMDIFRELSRIAQRQFEWQRGFVTLCNIYRSAFIYSGPNTLKTFESKVGMSLNDIVLSGFALWTIFSHSISVSENLSLTQIKISDDHLRLVLHRIVIPHHTARSEARKTRNSQEHIAYRRSILRKHPCISFGEGPSRLYAPLPDLVMLRLTAGLFYDIVSSDGHVRHEIGERYQSYCEEIIKLSIPDIEMESEKKFIINKSEYKTPDILIKSNSQISIIIECKANKMTIGAKFGEKSLGENDRSYMELVKGIIQIWRMVSLARRKATDDLTVAGKAVGVLLTLDPWFLASYEFQKLALKSAKNSHLIAKYKISTPDMIPISFVSIDDLEDTLRVCDSHTFLESMRALSTSEFAGWSLWGTHNHFFPHMKTEKEYPFEEKVSSVLPWWDSLRG